MTPLDLFLQKFITAFPRIGKVGWIRAFLVAVLVSFLIGLSPLLGGDVTVEEILRSQNLSEYKDALTKELDSGTQVIKASYIENRMFARFTVPIFVGANLAESAGTTPDSPHYLHEYGEPKISISFDLVAVYLAFVIIILFMMTILMPGEDYYLEQNQEEGKATEAVAEVDPRSYLEREVRVAKYTTDDIFKRSVIFLVAGILMSFVGMFVFFISLPPFDEQLSDKYLQQTIRPTAILIFLQAISWFLLRQYRSLIEDYKWFHKLYLKRSNYLLSIYLFSKNDVTPEDYVLVEALLQEDLSGKLGQGESSEAVERLKLPDEGPVDTLIKSVLELKYSKKGEG